MTGSPSMGGMLTRRAAAVIGARAEPGRPPPGGGRLHPRADDTPHSRTYAWPVRLPAWLTRDSHDPCEPAPPEVPWLRGMGVAVLIAFVVVSCVTEPRPALHGQGLLVALGLVIYAVAVGRGLPVHEVPT